MFEGMMKHTGQLNNTGKNVVVVFMQLPEDNDHALVIDTDALPDMFNESLRRVVESVEAQQSKNLADVLARRMSPDGSGTTLLQKFHQSGRLMKTPVGNVTMVPRRGVRWPLTEVISAMSGAEDSLPANFNDLDQETKAAIAAEVKKFNVHATNQDNQNSANKTADARALLEMARLLEADAVSKREQAYRLDASLRPKSKTVKAEITSESSVIEPPDAAAPKTKAAAKTKKTAD
jgi:hypothetical protein